MIFSDKQYYGLPISPKRRYLCISLHVVTFGTAVILYNEAEINQLKNKINPHNIYEQPII
jgi:hypothetical protein